MYCVCGVGFLEQLSSFDDISLRLAHLAYFEKLLMMKNYENST